MSDCPQLSSLKHRVNVMIQSTQNYNQLRETPERQQTIDRYIDILTYNLLVLSEKDKIKITPALISRFRLDDFEVSVAITNSENMAAAIRNLQRSYDEENNGCNNVNQNLMRAAIRIYESGRFLRYIEKTYEQYWYSDQYILRWVIIQYANSIIANPDVGLHLHINGISGTGKSDSAKAALKLIPEDKRIVGAFTKKGPIYLMSTIKPGTVILHDDHVADEEEMELNRAIISGWDNGYEYYSVKDQGTNKISIPKRINRIITNTDELSREQSGGQDQSRFITINHSRDKETAKKILGWIQGEHIVSDRRILICHLIWKYIEQLNRTIMSPIVDPETYNDPLQIRRFKQEQTVKRSIAAINNHEEATDGDVQFAEQMFTYTTKMLTTEIAGLTPREKMVYSIMYEYLSRKQTDHIEVEYLKKLVGSKITSQSFYEVIRGGHGGSLESPTAGLLTKIPGMHFNTYFDSEQKMTIKELTIYGTLINPINFK